MRIQRRTIVIGLGGTGCFSLRFVKERLQEGGLLPTEKQLTLKPIQKDDGRMETEQEAEQRIRKAMEQKQTAPIRFVPIDLDTTSRTKSLGASIEDDFVSLDQQKVIQKIKYIDKRENAVYKHWYPDPELEHIKLREASQGAGQWRVLGRLAYCENQNLIETRISEAIRELSGSGYYDKSMDTQHIDVVIISSTAGGTGAGMLLDVAYFLQEGELKSDASIKLRTSAFLLLPNVFAEWDTGHRTKANTYATLKELRGFYSQEKDFDMVYPNQQDHVTVKAGKVIPFSNIFLVDQDLGEKKLTTPDECFQYIGNLVYLRMVSPLSGEVRSAITNVRVPRKMKGLEEDQDLFKGGYVFSSCSGAIVQFPEVQEVADALSEWIGTEIQAQHKDQQSAFDETPADLSGLDAFFAPLVDPSQVKAIWTNHVGLIKEALSTFERYVIDRRIHELRNGRQGFLDTGWHERLANDIDEIAEKAANGFAKKLTINNLFASIESVHSIETFASILAYLDERLDALFASVDYENGTSDAGAREYEAFRDVIEEHQNTILQTVAERRSFPVGILTRNRRENPDLRESYGFPNWTSTAIETNYRDLEAAINEMKTLLDDPGKRRNLEQYIGMMFWGIVANRLSDQRKILKENRRRLKDTIEYVYDEQPVAQTRLMHLDEEVETEENLNVMTIPTEAIVEALKKEANNVTSFYHEMLNQAIFNPDAFDSEHRLRLSEYKRNVLTPLTIAEEPPVDKVRNKLNTEARLAIEQGRIRSGIGVYLSEIESLIGNARIRLFKNLRNNPCEESIVLWSFPTYRKGHRYPFYSQAEADLVKDRVRNMIRDTFAGCKEDNREAPAEENALVIYHETHHHPSENIGGIIWYWEEYSTAPFPQRLLHVHKDYEEDFEELIADEDLREEALSLEEEIQRIPVHCGNDQCDFDISDLPRDVYLCPNCDRPILNRCGNLNCDLDNLIDKIGGLKALDNTKTMCPRCRQDIKTFWWYCDRHEYQWREKGELFCPECNKEAEKEMMRYKDRSFRKDDKKYAVYCVNCKDSDREKPFIIPPDARELYYSVPKFKTPLLQTVLSESGIEKNLCPSCGSQLFPLCPYEAKPSALPHYVVEDEQSGEQRVTCSNFNAHKETLPPVYQCLHCHFPLCEEDTKCPRCRKEVIRCPNCSQDNRYLIPSDYLIGDNEDGCPVCKYQIETL